jgi:imidazolonepropionase-like amidohydrolase
MKKKVSILRILLAAVICSSSTLISLSNSLAQVTNETANTILIENVRIIVGDGSVIESGHVEFANGEITRVATGAAAAERRVNKTIINGEGKTLMPALIDAHSHLGYQGRNSWGSQNYGIENLIDNLQQYAYYGFSAVFSAGSDAPNIVRAVENSRRSGEFVGAQLLFAAGMAPPGQGPNNQFLSHALAVEEASGETILYGLENPEQAQAQVGIAAGKGIQFIKIWVDDRGGSQLKLSAAIYAAVIQEADRLGLKVFVHQQSASDIPALLSAGAHGFLHGRIGAEYTARIANQTRSSGAFVIPNWGLGELRQEAIGEDDFLNDIFAEEVMSPLSGNTSRRSVTVTRNPNTETELTASFRNIINAGVDIVLGTDAGAVPDHHFGYTGHRELEIYVRLGMTPMQALVAGTSNAARHLGLENRGQLKTGLSADLILLQQNPLEDIRNTRSIELVYLAGVEVERGQLQQQWKP